MEQTGINYRLGQDAKPLDRVHAEELTNPFAYSIDGGFVSIV